MKMLDRLLGRDDADYVDTKTMFGRTKVYDVVTDEGDLLRVLDVRGTWQSATFVNAGLDKLAFGYHQVFDRTFNAPIDITRALMLGGGALSYPRHVVGCHDDIKVDVVEIDPQIIELANTWFFLDQLASRQRSRLRVTCGDAVSFITDAVTDGLNYDLIVNDLFAAKEPTGALMSTTGLKLVKKALTSEGIYAVNVVSAIRGRNARPLQSVMDALEAVFSQVEVISLGDDEPYAIDNNVVFATNGRYSLADAVLVESF